MKTWTKNVILAALVVLITVVPLWLQSGAGFLGADAQAEAAIHTISADYQPWFTSIWEPPSGDVESLLFAFQAALGSGIVCFYFGYKKGQKSRSKG